MDAIKFIAKKVIATSVLNSISFLPKNINKASEIVNKVVSDKKAELESLNNSPLNDDSIEAAKVWAQQYLICVVTLLLFECVQSYLKHQETTPVGLLSNSLDCMSFSDLKYHCEGYFKLWTPNQKKALSALMQTLLNEHSQHEINEEKNAAIEEAKNAKKSLLTRLIEKHNNPEELSPLLQTALTGYVIATIAFTGWARVELARGSFTMHQPITQTQVK